MKQLDLLFFGSKLFFMYNKNFSNKPTERQKIGQVGEDVACKYLAGLGYSIVERNYLKKWGEIDVIAKEGAKLHFIEVKTVSRDSSVTYETKEGYRPEDNMHPWNLQRLSRVIQTYLIDRSVSDETDWQFDVITVYVDQNKGLSRVEILEDVVL